MLRSFHALKKCAPQMTQYLKYRAFSVLSSTRSMPEVLGDSGALKRQSVPRFLLKDFLKDDVRSKTAIYDGTNRISKTYEEVYKDCYSVAYNLRYTHNIKASNVVGLMAPNHINYLSAWLGISLTGAASTTINPIYTAEEVEFQLRQTEARAIVAHSMCLPVVKPVAEKLGIDVFCLDSDASESHGVLSWNALMDKPLGSIQPSDFVVDPDSIMTIPFSSGTTGVPKGVLLSHHNIVTNILQSMPDEGENMSPKPWRPEGSKVLVPLPFFHIYGMVAGMCVPLIAQAQMIFMQQFDLIRFLEIIQERKVDYTYIVPPIILALAKHPIVDNYDISSLKVVMSAAAPLGPELQQVAAERLNIFVKQGWGMTEISPIGITTPIPEGNPAQWDVPMEVKKILGKAGKLVPNTYAKICDIDSGAELEHTQEGELLIKGPQVMQGYLKNPEATSNTITADGWMKTGDVGFFDEDGFLQITDRCKELIKYKGFQVAPAELESVIGSMPGVSDVVVIPVLDEEAGEIPRAYVVKGDESLTEEQVFDFVAKKVAPHKKLRGGVRFAEEIPKSASGKILRRIQVQKDRGEIP